jgi:hypothetical protein
MKFTIAEIKQKFKQNTEKIIRLTLNGLLVALILLVGSMFLAFTNRIFISPPVDSNLEENVEKLTNQEVIQVSILNSTTISGLANKAKTFLQLRNFDVVEVGNYSTTLPTTKIIDRVGDHASAIKVAKALGVPDSLVTTQIDSTLFVRTTVVIGQDYPKLLPF